jgi:hypothetical protein
MHLLAMPSQTREEKSRLKRIFTTLKQATIKHMRRPRPSCQDEHGEIKAIVEPYWTLFNTALDHEHKPRIDHLTTTQQFIISPIIVITKHSLIINGRLHEESGDLAYPTGTSKHLQRQISKFNKCDFSIQVFLRYLSPLLEKIGAEIEWLTVCSNPRVVFHWSNRKPDPRVRHSVFLITAKSGEQFVADFTVEQFGFGPEMWFTKREEYARACTLYKPASGPFEEEVELARRGVFDRRGRVGNVIVDVCEREMGMWERLGRKGEMEWLEMAVMEAAKREWVERGEPPEYSSVECSVAPVPEMVSLTIEEAARIYYAVAA